MMGIAEVVAGNSVALPTARGLGDETAAVTASMQAKCSPRLFHKFLHKALRSLPRYRSPWGCAARPSPGLSSWCQVARPPLRRAAPVERGLTNGSRSVTVSRTLVLAPAAFPLSWRIALPTQRDVSVAPVSRRAKVSGSGPAPLPPHRYVSFDGWMRQPPDRATEMMKPCAGTIDVWQARPASHKMVVAIKQLCRTIPASA